MEAVIIPELAIDKEFRDLISPLTEQEYQQLEANILAEGCRDPLVVWAGVIVDGHNRYRICTEHGLPFTIKQLDFASRGQAVNWIIDNQLGRRNLTPAQMSILRGKRYNAEKQQGARNDLTSHQNDEKLTTSERLAEQYGVSPATIQRDGLFAIAADTAAAETGTPVMQLTKEQIVAAARKIEKEKKAARKKEIDAARAEIAKAGAEVKPDNRWHIYLADLATWNAPRQYDHIITDPPYPKEFLPLYETLAVRAKEWLKPGGLLIAMCGQSYFNQIIEMMCKHLTYYWTAAYLTPGQPTPLRQVNVNTSWKPLLIFSNGKYEGKIFGDVFKSDGNDKDFHKWGQSVSGMTSIVTKVCLPGQYILDPFCGAGTTGIAALSHGCLFDGVDVDEQNANIAKQRLQDGR